MPVETNVGPVDVDDDAERVEVKLEVMIGTTGVCATAATGTEDTADMAADDDLDADTDAAEPIADIMAGAEADADETCTAGAAWVGMTGVEVRGVTTADVVVEKVAAGTAHVLLGFVHSVVLVCGAQPHPHRKHDNNKKHHVDRDDEARDEQSWAVASRAERHDMLTQTNIPWH